MFDQLTTSELRALDAEMYDALISLDLNVAGHQVIASELEDIAADIAEAIGYSRGF